MKPMQLVRTTVGGTLAPSNKPLPAVVWRDGVLISPLVDTLEPFLLASRIPVWHPGSVPKWMAHQRAGDRAMYVLWVPSGAWLAGFAAFEAEHGTGRVYSIERGEWIDYDLRGATEDFTLTLEDGSEWRPAGTIAVDFANYDYDLAAFNGDAHAMRTAYACRETGTVALSMLAVLPTVGGAGHGRDLLDFAESWAVRVGFPAGPWRVEDGQVKALALCTLSATERNVSMYLRRGYTAMGEYELYWGRATFFVKRVVHDEGDAVVAAAGTE
ncbi:hypothetical protein H9P43_008125 [Blastocladiella emersonii ATCC 22665]|nr:hypothetical protein H9P43_008125 [Blastocladiella emersonii ATCC 22665]